MPIVGTQTTFGTYSHHTEHTMTLSKIIAFTAALSSMAFAHAGTAVQLGAAVSLPIVEGGLFTAAVVAVVAGVRIVRAKTKR
jgi:hypothetical protein